MVGCQEISCFSSIQYAESFTCRCGRVGECEFRWDALIMLVYTAYDNSCYDEYNEFIDSIGVSYVVILNQVDIARNDQDTKITCGKEFGTILQHRRTTIQVEVDEVERPVEQ